MVRIIIGLMLLVNMIYSQAVVAFSYRGITEEVNGIVREVKKYNGKDGGTVMINMYGRNFMIMEEVNGIKRIVLEGIYTESIVSSYEHDGGIGGKVWVKGVDSNGKILYIEILWIDGKLGVCGIKYKGEDKITLYEQ